MDDKTFILEFVIREDYENWFPNSGQVRQLLDTKI